MSEKQKRVSYNASFKLTVINYAKEHGNRAAERHFGRPPTEKMIREWRKQEDLLKLQKKDRKTFRVHQEKWPQLEVQMKNWIMNRRSNGLHVSTKVIIFEAKRWAAANGITNFGGTPSWCLRFMQRHGLCLRTNAALVQLELSNRKCTEDYLVVDESFNNSLDMINDSKEISDSAETCEDEPKAADTSSVPQITSNKKSEEDGVFEEKFDVADLVDIGQTFASADPLAEKTQEDDHHDFDEKSVINAQIQLQKNTASISTETNINRENVRKRVLASISSKPKRTKKDSEWKDSLDLFFDGIKSTMRQFSATDIHLLKAKIFSIVSEIEVKYLDVAETQTAADFEMVKVKEEPSDYHLEFGDEEEDERTVSILEERMIKEEMNNWHDIRPDDPLYLGDDNSGVEEEASNDNRSKVAFRPVLECCKNNCHSIINPERQMQINTEFCALVTKEEKDARVCAQVDVIGDDYKKERTRVYRLPDFSGFDVSVCKRMFCVVFNLTNEMLTNALSKKTFRTGKLPLRS